MSNIFEDSNVVFSYTWQDAVNDGLFIEITGLAKSWGFKMPVALTQSVYNLCHVEDKGFSTDCKITLLLLNLQREIRMKKDDDNRIFFKHNFNDGQGEIDVWASVEGRSMSNPEPVMTILLPEDY
jgi:hypothetical protein